MKKMKKIWISLITCVCLMAFFASVNIVAAEDEKVVINYLTVRTNGGIETVKALAEEYAKDHPNFEFNVETIQDRPAAIQKIKTLVASGNMPDWIDIDPTDYCRELIDAGMLVDCGEMLDRLGLTDYFYPMGLNYHEIEDVGLYTLPLDLNLEFYYYNTEIYEQYGLSVPTTWDEFFANCQILKENGVTPIGIVGVDGWPILRYFAMMPFRMCGNDWAKAFVAGEASCSDEYGTAAMEFIQTAAQYFQEGWSVMDNSTVLDLFLGGNVAMYHTGTWDLSMMMDEKLIDEMKGNIDFFKLPTIEGSPTTENQYFGHGGVGVAFNAKTWNSGMEDFFTYVIENYSEKALEIGGFIPMVKTELPDDSPELTKRCWAELANFESNILTWDVILDEQTNNYFNENLTALAMNLLSPEEFAQGADESVQMNLD